MVDVGVGKVPLGPAKSPSRRDGGTRAYKADRPAEAQNAEFPSVNGIHAQELTLTR